jgi:hypothetical protein
LRGCNKGCASHFRRRFFAIVKNIFFRIGRFYNRSDRLSYRIAIIVDFLKLSVRPFSRGDSRIICFERRKAVCNTGCRRLRCLDRVADGFVDARNGTCERSQGA